jgi:hypothetical protein
VRLAQRRSAGPLSFRIVLQLVAPGQILSIMLAIMPDDSVSGAAFRLPSLERPIGKVTLHRGWLRFRPEGRPDSIVIRVRDKSVLDPTPPPDPELIAKLRASVPPARGGPRRAHGRTLAARSHVTEPTPAALLPGITAYNAPPDVPPSEDLLNEFIALSERSDERILAFARKCGPLGLCAHDIPGTHAHAQGGPSFRMKVGSCRASGERVTAWRAWAAFARSLISLAEELREGRCPRLYGDDWRTVESVTNPGEEYHAADGRVAAQKRRVGQLVNDYWLGLGLVKPTFEWWGQGEPRLHLGSATLFSALAVQLTLAVAGTAAPAETCANPKCGRLYFPKRRPRAGERHWCQDCGKRAARTAAQRAYEFRLRARRLVREKGLSVPETAEQLGSDEATVRSWLRSKRRDPTRPRARPR